MKLYKKIDLFFRGQYVCSTQQSRTCKEARDYYLSVLNSRALTNKRDIEIRNNPEKLKASFAK